jgi:hypothetical protein
MAAEATGAAKTREAVVADVAAAAVKPRMN